MEFEMRKGQVSRKYWVVVAMALVCCAYLLSVARTGDPYYLIGVLTSHESDRVTWEELAGLLGQEELNDLPFDPNAPLPDVEIRQCRATDEFGETFRGVYLRYPVPIGGERAYSFVYNSSNECVLSSPDTLTDLETRIWDITGDGHLEVVVWYIGADSPDDVSDSEVLRVYMLGRVGTVLLLDVEFNIRQHFNGKDFFGVWAYPDVNRGSIIELSKMAADKDVNFIWDAESGRFAYEGNAAKDWRFRFPDVSIEQPLGEVANKP